MANQKGSLASMINWGGKNKDLEKAKENLAKRTGSK